jgi:multiple sugar transport system substrate-binding protein
MDAERDNPGEGTSRLSRRDLLKGAAAVGLAGSALSWREIVGSQTVWAKAPLSGNVTFWNLFGGGDGARMVQLEQGFRKANPSIKLSATTLAWGIPYYTKLTTSTVAGSPPGVAILHLSRMASFAPKGLFTELDPAMLAKFGISQSTVSKQAWDMAHYNGKLYAIPLDTHPLVMYYNTKFAKKAGLLQGNGRLKNLQGETAVMDAIVKAQHYAKVGLAISVAGAGETMPWRFWHAAYRQLGGSELSSNGKKVTLNAAHGAKATSFLSDITQKYKVAGAHVDYPASVALFNSQKAAFMWNGEWEATTFQKSGIPFDMTLFPNLFGSSATWADSHAFAIPRNHSMSQQQLEANLTFISYVLKHSVIWAEGGHIPAYLPVVNSTAYKKLTPQSHYAAEARDVVYDPIAPFSGAAGPMETAAGKTFQSVMTGQSTPSQGYSQFASALQKFTSSTGGPPGTE